MKKAEVLRVAQAVGIKFALVNEGRVEQTRNLVQESLCIVTNEKLMRGLDYRTTHGVGIDLLVAQNFTSKRAMIQGLNRVGRYGEPFSQFIYQNLKPYSLMKQLEKVGKIKAAMEKLKERKQIELTQKMEADWRKQVGEKHYDAVFGAESGEEK